VRLSRLPFVKLDALERRRLSRNFTMQRAAVAMGGHLTLIATFPDQEPVVLATRLRKDGTPAINLGCIMVAHWVAYAFWSQDERF
jgi:hypothetical protein